MTKQHIKPDPIELHKSREMADQEILRRYFNAAEVDPFSIDPTVLDVSGQGMPGKPATTTTQSKPLQMFAYGLEKNQSFRKTTGMLYLSPIPNLLSPGRLPSKPAKPPASAPTPATMIFPKESRLDRSSLYKLTITFDKSTQLLVLSALRRNPDTGHKVPVGRLYFQLNTSRVTGRRGVLQVVHGGPGGRRLEEGGITGGAAVAAAAAGGGGGGGGAEEGGWVSDVAMQLLKANDPPGAKPFPSAPQNIMTLADGSVMRNLVIWPGGVDVNDGKVYSPWGDLMFTVGGTVVVASSEREATDAIRLGGGGGGVKNGSRLWGRIDRGRPKECWGKLEISNGGLYMMDQIVLYVVATDISKRLEEGSEFDDFMLIDTGTTLATGPGASTDANTDGSGSLECCCFVS